MNVWPKGPWLGLTRARTKSCLALLGMLVIMVAIGWSSARAYLAYQGARAEQLLKDLEHFEVGQTTDHEVASVLERYEPSLEAAEGQLCTKYDCLYTVEMNSFVLSDLTGLHGWLDQIVWRVGDWLDNETLNLLGLRYWQVRGNVRVRNGLVSNIAGHVWVEAPCHQWLDGGWSLGKSIPEHYLEHDRGWIQDESYLVTWHHLHMGAETGEGLTAYVATSASKENRNSAATINLDCLNRLGGCTHLQQLMPRAAYFRSNAGSGAYPVCP